MRTSSLRGSTPVKLSVLNSELGRRIALNSWTLDPVSLADLVTVARQTGYSTVELRSTDFTRNAASASDIAGRVDLVRRSGLSVASLGCDGVLVQGDVEEQRLWFERLDRTAGIARAIGCETLMVSTGMINPVEIDVAARILAEAADVATASGLRTAFEFNALHPTLNSLGEALRLLSLTGRTDVGLALDSYHLCRSNSEDGLSDLDARIVFCVQLSDVPVLHEGQQSPLDRLTPGRGAVRWSTLFRFLDGCGYDGLVSFEAPNPDLWRADPSTVAREGLAAIIELWLKSRIPDPV